MKNTKRNNQIKLYTDILKENEYLLLKSVDSYFKAPFKGSPLNVLTNFSGSCGEAIIDKSGKIKIFVDSRYHILVDKQVYSDVEIYKMPLGESFFDAFKKNYPKNSVLHIPIDINLNEYLELDKYFDLRTYKIPDKYVKNYDIIKNSPVFLAEKKVYKNDFLYKVNKLKKLYPKKEKLVIFNLDEISWITNLRSFQTLHSSVFRSVLYLDLKNSNYILFLDNPKVADDVDCLKYMKLNAFKDFINSIDDKIEFDYKDISLDNFLSIKKPKNEKDSCLKLISSVKLKSEIEYLKKCCKKLDTAILNFKAKLKVGLSEKDLVEIFEAELLKTGAISTSFKTILSINENTASIHYSSYDKNKILTDDSIILLDCGGYWSCGLATDITRTFYYGAKPLDIHKKVYTMVLKAFIACYISDETDAQKLDKMARDILQECNADGFYFDHGLGHGIGTSVHQNPPRLGLKSKDIIMPYQVHSIEPGLYGKTIEGLQFGVRIENCVYSDVNYKKHSLSKFSFEEVLIDYNLLNDKEKEFVKFWQNGM